ncbi:hypothetical protein [Streptomyces sp900116325]|uniref:hypothetical protein n=1 Tax=Streptomyces sp. 900116325 TaxID=3154295 RepID=UPI0033B1B078
MVQRRDEEEAERLALRAAGKGNTRALYQLTLNAEKSGKRQEADRLARLVAGTGDTYGLVGLAVLRETAGDRVGAESLYREAAAAGSQRAHTRLAQLLERAGESSGGPDAVGDSRGVEVEPTDEGVDVPQGAQPTGRVFLGVWNVQPLPDLASRASAVVHAGPPQRQPNECLAVYQTGHRP